MRISDWSSDVCSSDLGPAGDTAAVRRADVGRGPARLDDGQPALSRLARRAGGAGLLRARILRRSPARELPLAAARLPRAAAAAAGRARRRGTVAATNHLGVRGLRTGRGAGLLCRGVVAVA